jgi:acyl carrier protein
MTVRDTIAQCMAEIAIQQNKALPPLTDGLNLMDTGFDSLCFAILVAQLEDELGVDPFAAARDVRFPKTFGDMVAFYSQAA